MPAVEHSYFSGHVSCCPLMSTDVYRCLTKYVKSRHANAWQNILDSYTNTFRNHAVVGQLRSLNQHNLASKLEVCGLTLSGNDLYQLKPTHYCRQSLLCVRCAEVKSAKRAEQVQRACAAFAEYTRRSLLSVHSFRIKPKQSGFRSGQDTFIDDVQILRQFMFEFAKIHDDHSLVRALKRNSVSLEKTLGPTGITIHLVPGDAYQNHKSAHLHLCLTTTREVSAKQVKQFVHRAWSNACNHFGREPDFDHELHMSRQTLPDEVDRNPSLRAGRFNPTVDDPHTNSAMSQFRYITVPGRFQWSADQRIDVLRMVTKLHIKPHQLHQQLGMMRERVEQMPDSFDFYQLQHLYVANMDAHSCKIDVYRRITK